MNTFAAYLAATNQTQEAFARKGGWRQATISDWCTGRKTPNLANAAAIERLTEGAVPMSAWASIEAA